jgi:hypothetical protein
MKSRKVLTIGPKDGPSSDRRVLHESDSVDELLEKGIEHALLNGVKTPKWLNVSRPAMGDKKLTDELRRYSMVLDSKEVLFVE